ncbi:MAG: hypothetical protein A2Y10_05060 [Planctomycetes bacterium GWF2_41_51]|nr:MAG: hypothetical protein A2Y10_05060 [Planctomycetes bacterium GWF2_41_51]HBG25566.1 hypothetical protein [Phycisphaerales bacterium]
MNCNCEKTSNKMKIKVFKFCLLLFSGLCFLPQAFANDMNWWPQQKAPETIAKLYGVRSPADAMLAQSLSGLAAQAVNEDRFKEMVWIEDNRPDYMQWYAGLQDKLHLKESGKYQLWDLAKRYAEKGIIKGYVLYDYSADGMNSSVNIATVAAGQFQAMLIEASQQSKAKELNLELLFDARGKDYFWCFENFKQKLNRNLLLTQSPTLPSMRDMAIAHKTMVLWDINEPFETVLKWLEPGTAVMGWNKGDEKGHVGPVSVWGHFQTASDHAQNIPLLSAANRNITIKQVKACDPAKIDYSSKAKFVSFLMSDGDNVQWQMGRFAFNESFWANPEHGKFPMGWSSCLAQLAQVCPEAIDYLSATQPDNSTLVEFSGGYFYPDLFAVNRSNRLEVLTKHARKLSFQMNRSGARTLCFIVRDVNSPAAKEAYQVFANEIDGLVGMIALQYHPYSGGMGKVFWLTNRQGIEIPVLTAKYAIWKKARYASGGSPEKIIKIVNADPNSHNYNLIAVHAWSMFKDAADYNDQDKPSDLQAGLSPVAAGIKNLDSNAKIISPEEMLWRIRMDYNSRQTQNVISTMKNMESKKE